MLKLLHSIFASRTRQTTRVDENIIQLATERVVDGTDPRLRAVSGYRKKLCPAIERSVEYVIEFIDGLPPSIDFGKDAIRDRCPLTRLLRIPNRFDTCAAA